MQASLQTYHEIQRLVETYARLLDADRLEDWLDLFDEDCHYEIMSRENVEQNLPLSLMLCDNKDMLRDRVMSLREANIYNIHVDCHILSLLHVEQAPDGLCNVGVNYALFQSNQEGETRLFSAGRYEMTVVSEADQRRFRKVRVVVDTGAILTLLATPI
jgi:anthranilate 1,2-dioxygenase small subunit